VFLANWSPSTAICLFETGSSALFNIVAYNTASPTGTVIAQITFTGNGVMINGLQQGVGVFSTMNQSFTFNPGDWLQVIPQNTNCSMVAISLRGTYPNA
jgi:hypothetical protein